MIIKLDDIKSQVIPVLKESGVLRSSLFGSYVRGHANENSDIDILIEFPKGKSLLDLVALERKLEESLGKKVDVLTYKSVSPHLKQYIERHEPQIL